MGPNERTVSFTLYAQGLGLVWPQAAAKLSLGLHHVDLSDQLYEWDGESPPQSVDLPSDEKLSIVSLPDGDFVYHLPTVLVKLIGIELPPGEDKVAVALPPSENVWLFLQHAHPFRGHLYYAFALYVTLFTFSPLNPIFLRCFIAARAFTAHPLMLWATRRSVKLCCCSVTIYATVMWGMECTGCLLMSVGFSWCA